MKRAVMTVVVLVAMIYVAGDVARHYGRIYAASDVQQATPPASTDVTLTEAEEQKLELAFLKFEKVAQAATPEAMAKAIADYITSVQAATQKAQEEFASVMTSTAKEGFDIRRTAEGKFILVKREQQ